MSNVYMDPSELRRTAERILGNREFDYRPELDKIRDDILVENDAMAAAMEGQKEGYVYGRSGIGPYHDECVQDLIRMFESIDTGLIAISNVLAAVAEDYAKTDGEAGSDLAATLGYFAMERADQH